MKFSILASAWPFAILTGQTALSGAVDPSSSGANLRGKGTDGGRVLKAGTSGTFLLRVDELGPDDGDRRLRKLQGRSDRVTQNVEIGDEIYEITNAPPGWAKDLTSGDTTITIPPGATKRGAVIDMGGGSPGVGGPKSLFGDRKLEGGDRRLAVVEGVKTVLAVKVIHNGPGSLGTTGADMTVTAREIFGSAVGMSDAVNLHSQYKACSHDKLDFQPRTGNANSGPPIVNGVVEITVGTDCSSGACDGQMRNDVFSQFNAIYGQSASSLADHVMLCLPSGAMSGIAYAYINSWQSVYSNQWCLYPSAQLHEIGHNLNLAHSNEGVNAYQDQTGFMGYSYNQDEQRMCFNNAKNWQLGWFTGSMVTVNINGSYDGKLIGQVNYDGTLNNGAVIVKVQDPSSSNALYIGFNHRVKHNINSAEGGNQVTAQTYSGSGYNASDLKWKLSAGASASYTLGSTPVQITVGTIDTAEATGHANVVITYGAPPPPTPPPTTSAPTTASPTPNPTTGSPTPKPTTSAPTTAPPTTSPTTGSPTPKPTTSAPTTASPTPSPTTGSPSKSPTKSPTKAPTPSVPKYICQKWEPAQNQICVEGAELDNTCQTQGQGCRNGGKSCWIESCPSSGPPPSPTTPGPTPPSPAPPTSCPVCGNGSTCCPSNNCPGDGTLCGTCEDFGKPSRRACV